MFDLLRGEEKIDGEAVHSMRGWPHSGFGIDQSVPIAFVVEEGMRGLASTISRCPFSLARMVKARRQSS